MIKKLVSSCLDDIKFYQTGKMMFIIELDDDLKSAAEHIMRAAHISPAQCIVNLYKYIAKKQRLPYILHDDPGILSGGDTLFFEDVELHRVKHVIKNLTENKTHTLSFLLEISISNITALINEYIDVMGPVADSAEAVHVKPGSPSSVLWGEILRDLHHVMELVTVLSNMDKEELSMI